MDKAVLISIQPQWCEEIASEEKTLEIRKTKPKLQTPFKCYIYCTKNELLTRSYNNGSIYVAPYKKYQKALESNGNITLSGKVIGEFVCDRIEEYQSEFVNDNCYEDIRLVWDNEDKPYEAEKEFEIITSNEKDNPNDCRLCKDACLTFGEIKSYVGIGFAKTFYGWHISDLVIYDKPKQLSEFNINRAPQSWCYVQED